MTSYTRTWTHSQNLVPTNQDDTSGRAASILFDFKVKLLAAGWTVASSSDGSTAQVIGSGDLWDTYDKVEVCATGARSWIILKSPNNYPSTGNNVYLMIERKTTDVTEYAIAFSSIAWSGSPTTNQSGMSNANAISAHGRHACSSGSDTAHKLHVHTSSIGDFIFYVSKDSGGSPGSGMFLNKLSDSQSGDNWPVVAFSWNHNSYAHSTAWTQSGANSYYNPFQLGHSSYSISNSNAYSGTTTYSKTFGWWTDGTPVSTRVFSVTDALLAYFDGNGDDHSGKFLRFPMYVVSHTLPTNQNAYKGQITDLKLSHSLDADATEGTVSPLSGSIDSAIIDHIMIPASAAPSF